MPIGIYDRTNAKKTLSLQMKERWNTKREEFLERFKTRDNTKGGRPRTIARDIRNCLICNIPFEAKKTSSKKYCTKKCYQKYFNEVYKQTPEYKQQRRETSSKIDRSYMQTEAYRQSRQHLVKYDRSEYHGYRHKVQYLTKKTYEQHKEVINPNNYPRTLCGVDGGWQLDHIKSVRKCFDEGISPEEASSITNLRMLPWRENLTRK